MPGPIPNPVIAWTGGIVHIQEYIHHYLDEPLVWLGAFPAPDTSWRRLSAKFRWAGSTDTKDDMYVTFDIVNITGGTVDGTWTTSDYTTMETKLDTFFTAIAAVQSNLCQLVEYRWYVRSYNPYTTAIPFAPHGAPERVTTRALNGAASGAPTAAQVAMTVTKKTPFPRNWGRIFIPAIGSGIIVSAAPPRFNTGQCDAVANAMKALVDSMATNEFQLVVPITSLGTGSRGTPGAGTANRRLAQVTSIQVDNVPDVIRRRRIHNVTYRKKLP